MKIKFLTKKQRFLNNSGFTLLEVLVAAVILAMGLLGTAGFLTTVIKSDKLSNEMSTAVVLTQAKAEEIFQAGYLEMLPDLGATVTENFNTIPGYAHFKRSTTISDTGTPGALGVAVRVDYKAFGPHTFTARTILSRDIQ